jgi:hypothetical protein
MVNNSVFLSGLMLGLQDSNDYHKFYKIGKLIEEEEESHCPNPPLPRFGLRAGLERKLRT